MMQFQGTRSDVGYQNQNRASSSASPVLSPRAPPDVHGRHRKRAELKRLQQEIRMLEEELQVVEGYPPASKVCRELVQFTETCVEPLLPIARGPMNPQWNRWFQYSANTDEDCCCLNF